MTASGVGDAAAWTAAGAGLGKLKAGLTKPVVSGAGMCSGGVKGGWALGTVLSLEGSVGGLGGSVGSSPRRRRLRRNSWGDLRPGVRMMGRRMKRGKQRNKDI